jgi:hypothetical protein
MYRAVSRRTFTSMHPTMVGLSRAMRKSTGQRVAGGRGSG